MLVEIKAFVGPPVNYISLDTGKHCERLGDYFSIHWPSRMRNPHNVTCQVLHIPAPPLRIRTRSRTLSAPPFILKLTDSTGAEKEVVFSNRVYRVRAL